jgi:membrane-associated protein
VLDSLLALAGSSLPLLVVVAYVVALGESVPGLGFLLPGEMTIIAMSAIAGPTGGSGWLWVAVTLGAVTGDQLGYTLGSRYGQRARTWRLLRRVDPAHWDRAETFARRHGAPAVVGSRMVPVVRTLLPVVAGGAGVDRRRFILASVAGCGLWSALWVGCGAALHAALGPAALPTLAVGGIAAAVLAAGVVAARRTSSSRVS